MKVFNLIFLIYSWFKITLGYNGDIDMIVDVIKFYERPTAVVAKLCWGATEKRNLMVRLMNKTKYVKVLYIDEYEEIEKFDPIDMLVLFDLSCHNVESFLTKANLNLKFKSPSRWFFVTEEIFDIIPKKLQNLNILLNSEALIHKMENDTTVLYMVYRIDPSKEFLIENYGTWTKQNGFNKSNEMILLSLTIRRKDLQRKPIATSMVILDKNTPEEIESVKDTATDNLSKNTYHHLNSIYDFMNASKVLIYTNTWGYYINNSWNGMMGDIVHRDADLCGTVSFMTLDRTRILAYLSQPIPFIPKFFFREPPLSFQNNLYVLPFKSTVWLCIGGLVLILIVIIYVIAKWESSLSEDTTEPLEPGILRANVSDIAIFIVSALTQQGSNSLLKGSLGRVVTFLMLLIFLFLYTSYSANIVALLQSSSDQIKTLSDLLNSKFELGVEDEPYTRHYFTTATDPVKKAIYETKIAKTGYKPNFMTIEEGVLKMRNKDAPFAFHMNMGLGNKKVEELFQEHEKCDIHEIEYISNGRPWLCSRKTSPYTEIYKIGAARINEHGLSDRMNRIFYVVKIFCNSRGGSFASVNMVDFHPVLLWLVYGMTLAFLLLGLENVMHRKLRGVGERRGRIANGDTIDF